MNPVSEYFRPMPRWRMAIPNGRHYAVLEVDSDAHLQGDVLTDDELDHSDRWFAHLRPDGTIDVSGPEVTRWHVRDPNDSMDVWQGELGVGPNVFLIADTELSETSAEGYQQAVAVSLPSLVAWWTGIAIALPDLLVPLGCHRGNMRLALQTLPSGRPPVVDLSFGESLAPQRAGPARSVPAWQHGPMAVALDTPPMQSITDATVSLVRHFGYRHPDACIGALGLPLSSRKHE
jgi:hypothetical protein